VPLAAKVQCASAGKDYCEDVPKRRVLNEVNAPDLIFVIDTVREQIAIKEANKLNIPIAAIIDTNCDPEGITYPIPGNDDSTKSIKLYCDLVSQAALDGISIQSQKVQEETQDKKEKPQKETISKEDNKSKELSDTPKTDDGKEIENLEENNDKSKSEEKD
jgi:small subunit ribosomal protein S2